MNEPNKEPRIKVVYDRKKQATANKPAPIWIGITFDRNKVKYVSTGIKVLPQNWSDQWWVIGRSDAGVLNQAIKEHYEKARAGVTEWLEGGRKNELSSNRLKANIPAFIDWMYKKIESGHISAGTRKNHLSVYHVLSEYGKIIEFSDVNRKNILSFLEWARKRTVKKMEDYRVVVVPISDARIYDYWKVLRKYIHLAQLEEFLPYGVIDGITIPRGESREREHLTDEEIEIWQNTPMPSVHLSEARDRFLVQMGTGLAYSDLVSADFTKRRVIGGNITLSGRRTKTREQFFSVILPIAQEVLERWGWKVPSISLQDYNRYLLEIARYCGIEKHITSHVGRHTYACQCLAHGVRLEAVQRTLGHASIKTTQIYAKLVDNDVSAAFSKTDFWDKDNK